MALPSLRRRPPDIAVDLGTSHTRIWVRGSGVVVDEPTVVATHRGARGREVVAVGAEAREMIGRTPAGTEVVRPVRGGVVADFEATEQLLTVLLRRALGRTMRRPRIVVCVPSTTTEVERRAVQESARSAGAREVALLPTAMCAAAGAGLPIKEPVGSVIVDVGGGRTEVAVVSLGGMVVYRSARVAGDAMDDAITAWLRAEHDVDVGTSTAEGIKITVGGAMDLEGPVLRTIVRGRDLQGGGPRELGLTSTEVVKALAVPVAAVRDALLEVLAETPPELSADLVDRGVLVCGGAARLRGLSAVLRDASGLAVLEAEQPETAVARGAGELMEDQELFDRVAIST